MIYYLCIDVDPNCEDYEKYIIIKNTNYIFTTNFDVIIQIIKIEDDNYVDEWISKEQLQRCL